MPLFGPPDVKKLKAAGDIPGLLKALGQTKHRAARRFAAYDLGDLGDVRAVEPLITALADPDKELARVAAQSLGQIGDARAVEPLIAALSDPDHSVPINAAGALGQIGEPSVEPLIALLEARRRTSALAAFALGCSRDPRAVDPLVDALAAKEDELRKWSAEALARIGAPAVEPLIAALSDEQSAVRLAAAQVLGQIGERRAVEPLVALCHDRDAAVRKAAATALKSLGWQGGEDVSTTDLWIAKRDWDKCVEIGASAVEPLTAALSDDSAGVRKGAAAALGRIGDPRAVEALKAALRDQSKTVSSAAATALDELGWRADASPAGAAYWIAKGEWDRCAGLGKPALDVLLPGLRSKDTCASAAKALGQIGSPRAVGPLLAALKSERLVPRGPTTREVDPVRARGLTVPVPGEPDVREAVADALAAIGPPAVEPLIAELGNWGLRDLVVRALGQIAQAREPLVKAILDENQTVRGNAIAALSKLEWSPEHTRAGAIYCIARGDWAGCAAVGGPAVEPLIAELRDDSRYHRTHAAQALTTIWRAGGLRPAERSLLLAQREAMVTPHHDGWYRQLGDDEHADSGIGVEFPL